MKIGIHKEVHAGEKRVAATPETVGQLAKLGYTVAIEAGAGEKLKAYLKQSEYQYEIATQHFMFKNYDTIFDFFNKSKTHQKLTRCCQPDSKR